MTTYTFYEALDLLTVLDYEGMIILGEVITEEQFYYPKDQLNVLIGAFNHTLSIKKAQKKLR